MKQRSIQRRRGIAFVLALAICFALLCRLSLQETYAGDYEVPLTEAITTYYEGSQNKILDDWEEFAAVYAYLENQSGNAYTTGVDISDYVLPSVGTGAGGLFAALMKGDIATATTLANSLVSSGSVVDPGYISTYAVQVLALEAYNRSTGVIPVEYSTGGAIAHLLAAQDTSGGYSNPDWYDPSIYNNDYDSSGFVLAVLSLPAFSGYPEMEKEKSDLIGWMKDNQSSSGAFAAWGSDSANSTACVLFGLSAAGENLSEWTTSPALGLLDENLYTNEGGWLSRDGFAWDSFATKQATLALAEVESGQSFYANLQLNSTAYLSATMQLVKPDGTFTQKNVTVANGSALDTVASVVSGSAIAGGFNYYKDGAPATTMTERSTILGVADNFNSIVFFSYNGSGIGAASAEVGFGGSATFELKELTLSTGNLTARGGIPIDINGDSFGEIYSTTVGQVDFFPVHSSSTLAPIASDYYGLYIATDAAILPAYVSMVSGGAQTKTVSIRAEGPSENIIYYSAYDVTGNGINRLTVGDAITQALADADLSYTYSGGYLSMVENIAAGSYAPNFYDGWVYYINGVPGGTMSSQPIDNGDSIVLYYGYYPGYGTDLVSLNSSVSGSTLTLTVLNGTTPVPGVTINWNSSDLSTTTDVLGRIVVENINPGTYPVQISKVDAYGVPLVVRLVGGTAITVTSEGGSNNNNGSGDIHTASKVYLTVKGLDGSILYSNTGLTYYVGITVRDILDASGLTILGNSNYVSSINGLSEFDYGSGSGWLYTVNAALPGTTAAKDYELELNDQVVWYYTRNYTADGNVKDFMEDVDEIIQEEASGSSINFWDVPQGAWYKDAATKVSALGLFNGVADREFGPELSMTREMFVTVLGRLYEKNHTISNVSAIPFDDVPIDSYYSNHVAWASQNGIVEGFGRGQFGIEHFVTREQMAVFMYRYMEFLGLLQNEKVSDISGYNDRGLVSDWAQDAVAWALKNGLLIGMNSDILDPAGDSSRAEVAIFVLRCFNYIDENTI